MDVESVVRLRTAIARVARQLNATSTGEGLTPTQASVLGVVAARGPIGLAELADFERLNPTMVSRLVGKLSADGLIERQADPADLRSARVKITAMGAQVHQRIKRRRTLVLARSLSRMPAEAVDALLTAVPALDLLAAELADGGNGGP